MIENIDICKCVLDCKVQRKIQYQLLINIVCEHVEIMFRKLMITCNIRNY